MKSFKNAVSVLAFVAPLFVASASTPYTVADGAVAAKLPALPFGMTIVLSRKEAENLYKSSFEADKVFGKEDRHHQVKESYWTLTSADVAQAEASLTVYVKTSTHPFKGPAPIDLLYYFRQYAGVKYGDKKIILINAFPADHKRGIAAYDHIPHVSDGGWSYFHAAYDPETRKVQNFEFNGVG